MGSTSVSRTANKCCCHYVALCNSLSADRGAPESPVETINMQVSRAKGQRRHLCLWGRIAVTGLFITFPSFPMMMEKTDGTRIQKGQMHICMHEQGRQSVTSFTHAVAVGLLHVIVCLRVSGEVDGQPHFVILLSQHASPWCKHIF